MEPTPDGYVRLLGRIFGEDPEDLRNNHVEGLTQAVDEAIASIQPNYAHVLRIRFGLDTGRYLSLAETGAILVLTRERIRVLESKGLRDLRNEPLGSFLRPFYANLSRKEVIP